MWMGYYGAPQNGAFDTQTTLAQLKCKMDDLQQIVNQISPGSVPISWSSSTNNNFLPISATDITWFDQSNGDTHSVQQALQTTNTRVSSLESGSSSNSSSGIEITLPLSATDVNYTDSDNQTTDLQTEVDELKTQVEELKTQLSNLNTEQINHYIKKEDITKNLRYKLGCMYSKYATHTRGTVDKVEMTAFLNYLDSAVLASYEKDSGYNVFLPAAPTALTPQEVIMMKTSV
jgi:hypothetical protein